MILNRRFQARGVILRVAAVCIVTSLYATGNVAAQDVATQDVAATIADLSWIAGSWGVTDGSQTIEEHWTGPTSNALLGMGRTIADGRMVAFEYLRIIAIDDGIFYMAQPNGRSPTSFRLTQWDGETATFENPDHDFPKRIVYTRSSDNAIRVIVDAGEGSEALTFTYTRVMR